MKNINTDKDNLQPCTVIIFSYNSAHEIEECIDSAFLLTRNVLLVDMESKDNTVSIAKQKGVDVFSHPFTQYVETVRDFGIQKSNTDWVFILDADERITLELAKEVQRVIQSPESSFYKVPRKDFFGKKIWLQHGGWWPNHQTRLINKQYFKEWPKIIHSTPVIEGKLGILTNPLLHYSKNDYEKVVNKTIIFEDLESDLLFKANRPVSIQTFFRKYFGELYRRLFKGKGFMDGAIGVIESMYQAFSKTITYIYLYEKKNSRPL